MLIESFILKIILHYMTKAKHVQFNLLYIFKLSIYLLKTNNIIFSKHVNNQYKII